MYSELRRIEGTNQRSASIQSDGDGYLDRQCHTEECMFTQWVPGHLQPQLGLEVQGVTTS